MDERVKGEYRKIYSELVSLILMVAAVSLLVKFLLFDYGIKECATEFVILIGSALYLAVRQYMLGLRPEDVMPPEKRKKKMVISLAIMFVGYFAVYMLKNETAAGSVWTNVLCFMSVYVFVYWFSGKLAEYFSGRKGRKYEE